MGKDGRLVGKERGMLDFPFTLSILCCRKPRVARESRAFWNENIEDAFAEHPGYFKADIVNPKKQDEKLIFWKSVVTENSRSLSRIMYGPVVWWPVQVVLSVSGFWIFWYLMCSGWGSENGMIGGASYSTVSCMVWAVMALSCAVWAAPANIPFFFFRDRYVPTVRVYNIENLI